MPIGARIAVTMSATTIPYARMKAPNTSPLRSHMFLADNLGGGQPVLLTLHVVGHHRIDDDERSEVDETADQQPDDEVGAAGDTEQRPQRLEEREPVEQRPEQAGDERGRDVHEAEADEHQRVALVRLER